MRHTIYILAIIFLSSTPAFSTFEYPDWENFISGDFVRDMDLTGDSLWVTTNGGLVMINTTTDEIEYFNPANSGILKTDLDQVIISPAGTLWLTEYHLSSDPAFLFNKGRYRWNVFHKYNSSLQGDVGHFAIDENNEKWIGTKSGGFLNYGGLCHIDDQGKWHTYSVEKDIFPMESVDYIAIDKNDYKWIAGGSDLIKFKDKEWTEYNRENSGLPGSSINVISIDKQNRKWIGTENKGLAIFDDENWTIYNSTNSGLPNAPIHDIDFDLSGNAWIGTGKGLVMFDGENWTKYDSTNSGIEFNKVNAVQVGKHGGIWVGYEYSKGSSKFGGLVKFDDNEWKHYEISNSKISENFIYSVLTDKDNETWFVSNKNIYKNKNNEPEKIELPFLDFSARGYYRIKENDNTKWFYAYNSAIKYDGENWTVYDTSSSNIFKYGIFDLTFDKEGNTWIATWGGGIAKYDGTGWTTIDTSNSDINFQKIGAIELDNEGTMWLGTFDGLLSYDGENWELFNTENSGLIDDQIIRIFVDEENNKWIALNKGGLCKYDGENWSIYTKENSDLYSDRVNDLKIDANKNIWIATYYGGIAKLENEEWTVYRLGTSGLQDDKVYGIDFDLEGNLWIGTLGGLALFKNAVSGIFEQESPVISHINYPNPFKQHTNISYELEQAGFVSISVFDSFGEEVATLVNTHKTAGKHITEFDAEGISPGVYYYTIRANSKTDSGKLVVVR